MKLAGKRWAWMGIVAVLAVNLYAATAVTPRDFQIPGHGSLRFEIPDGWKVESQTLRGPAAVGLHFAPRSGNSFDVQVTAVWLDTDKLAKTTSPSLKETTQRVASELLPHSVEKVATIKEISGTESVGHFFALTDAEPGPGEFQYVTQGTFLTGEVLSAFTILYRAPTTPEVAEAIRIFNDAKYVR